MKPTIDIVIPSYNAKYLLEKNLPTVIKFSANAKIIVVDDGSTDGTQEYLKEHFPEITCLHQDKNKGFSISMNIGINHSKADFVVFLNNDILPTNDYLEKSLKYFKDNDIFGASFNEESSSWPEVSWHSGKFQFTRGKDKTKPHYSAWLSGGSAIVKRDYLEKLHGFNEIYSPGYWEDIDLGWRAWKSGLKILWIPDAQVVHHHASSFSKLKSGFINTIKQRNELLFIWQNFSETKYLLRHKIFILLHALRHPGYFRIIFLGFIKYIAKGKKTKGLLTDTQVLESINKPYEY